MNAPICRAGLFCLTVLASTQAEASPITVANSSFEILPGAGLPNACGLGCSFSVNDPIPSWTSAANFGQFQAGVQAGNFTYFNTLPDGVTVAYVNSGAIGQTVTALAQSGVTYTLEVDLGFRKDLPDPGVIQLKIGANTITAIGIPAQLSGNWATYIASYTALAADVGSSISILLSSSDAQGDFDNVRLSDDLAVSLPESSTLAIFGAGLVFLAFRRREKKPAKTSSRSDGAK